MQGEFEKEIRKIADKQTSEKLVELIKVIGEEFPCFRCPSNLECSSFAWFTKWFGNMAPKPEC